MPLIEREDNKREIGREGDMKRKVGRKGESTKFFRRLRRNGGG